MLISTLKQYQYHGKIKHKKEGYMMERIAIISDIHGNLEALKTVLQDIETRGIQRIFCLGDIVAKGVHAKECLALLKEKCQVIIQGNCDEFVAKSYSQEELNSRIIWNQTLLSKEERQALLALPFSYDFYLSGALIRLVHATPWANNVFIGAASSLQEEWQMFLPTSKTEKEIADIVIYGHTHTPYINKAFHHTLINAGSVGNPIEIFQDHHHLGNYSQSTRACYLILEGNYQDKKMGPLSYSYVHIPYDIEKELSSPISNPEKEAYENELRYAKYRDMDKLKLKIK